MNQLLLSILLCSFLSSCAQQKNAAIQRGYVFYRIQTPGMIAVDRDGQPKTNSQDTAYLVFVEVDGTAPIWKSAWTNNQMFALTATEINMDSVTVGKNSETAQTITISSTKNHRLYQLLLKRQKIYAASPITVKEGQLLIETEINAKKNYYTISNSVQLTPQFFQ